MSNILFILGSIISIGLSYFKGAIFSATGEIYEIYKTYITVTTFLTCWLITCVLCLFIQIAGHIFEYHDELNRKISLLISKSDIDTDVEITPKDENLFSEIDFDVYEFYKNPNKSNKNEQ